MKSRADRMSIFLLCFMASAGIIRCREMNCIPNEDLSFDLDRLAEVMNFLPGLTGISDIKLCHMNGYFYYIKADGGEFEVSQREYTNPFRDNETLEAMDGISLGTLF